MSCEWGLFQGPALTGSALSGIRPDMHFKMACRHVGPKSLPSSGCRPGRGGRRVVTWIPPRGQWIHALGPQGIHPMFTVRVDSIRTRIWSLVDGIRTADRAVTWIPPRGARGSTHLAR